MTSRAQRANAALSEYCRVKGEPLECHETGIIDLMADLMHLAHNENLDGFDLSRIAQKHFLVELATGSKPETRHITSFKIKGECPWHD